MTGLGLKATLDKVLKTVSYPLFFNKKKVFIKPSFVSLAVAETCCFQCKHCEIWKFRPQKDWMDFNQTKAVLDKLYDWLGDSYISFSGGEPFLNQNFIKIVEYAKGLGFKTFVNTNAFLLDEKKVKAMIKAGIGAIHVSIDGLEDEHDFSRGKKGAFKKAEKVIKWFNNNRDLSKDGFELGTTSILMKSSMKRLDELIAWGERVGLDKMHFQALWENFGVIKHDPDWYKKSKFWPSKDEARRAIEILRVNKRKKGIIGNTYAELADYLEYFEKNPIEIGKEKKCYVGVRNFAVALNGDVRLCYFFKPVGNILKNNPEDIYNNLKAQKQRIKIAKCKRGCKILICNRKLKVGDIIEKSGGQLKSKFFKN